MAIKKQLSAVQGNLKLRGKELADLRKRFSPDQFRGNNKPASYASDEEYTELFKLGPIVEEALEAIKALEQEIEDLHTYLEAELNTGDSAVFTTDEAGDVIVDVDKIDLGEGTDISGLPGGGISFSF